MKHYIAGTGLPTDRDEYQPLREEVSGYVVYGCEHLRDGIEEWAKAFSTLDGAMDYINRDRFARDNHEWAVFELGRRVSIEVEEVQEPQPPIAKKQYKIKED